METSLNLFSVPSGHKPKMSLRCFADNNSAERKHFSQKTRFFRWEKHFFGLVQLHGHAPKRVVCSDSKQFFFADLKFFSWNIMFFFFKIALINIQSRFKIIIIENRLILSSIIFKKKIKMMPSVRRVLFEIGGNYLNWAEDLLFFLVLNFETSKHLAKLAKIWLNNRVFSTKVWFGIQLQLKKNSAIRENVALLLGWKNFIWKLDIDDQIFLTARTSAFLFMILLA